MFIYKIINDFKYHILIVVLLVIIYHLNNKQHRLVVYWFHKPGCPHCDVMEEEWAKVEGHMWQSGIVVKRVDTSKPEHSKVAKNFNITTVPLIVKIKPNGMRYKYEGKRKAPDMINWIAEEEHDL